MAHSNPFPQAAQCNSGTPGGAVEAAALPEPPGSTAAAAATASTTRPISCRPRPLRAGASPTEPRITRFSPLGSQLWRPRSLKWQLRPRQTRGRQRRQWQATGYAWFTSPGPCALSPALADRRLAIPRYPRNPGNQPATRPDSPRLITHRQTQQQTRGIWQPVAEHVEAVWRSGPEPDITPAAGKPAHPRMRRNAERC